MNDGVFEAAVVRRGSGVDFMRRAACPDMLGEARPWLRKNDLAIAISLLAN